MAATSTFTPADVKPGQTKLLINGEWTAAASGKTFATVNPVNETKIADVAEADAADADRAVTAARRAFDEGPWTQKITATERGKMLYKLADLVEANKKELAALET